MKNYTPEYRLVDVSMMERHPLVQRDMRESHVRRIMKDYNPLFINPLTVAYTTSGANRRYWIIDGGHTHEVSLRKGVKQLWCKVINVHSYAEISEIFVGMNKNKLSMSAADTHQIESDFRADSDAANIDRIFDVNGITREDIGAWRTVHKVYKDLGDDRFAIFAALLAAVKDGGASIDMPTIQALQMVVKRRTYAEMAGSDIAEVLESSFLDIKQRAGDSLRNRNLHQSPGTLAQWIEDEVFGMGVAA